MDTSGEEAICAHIFEVARHATTAVRRTPNQTVPGRQVSEARGEFRPFLASFRRTPLPPRHRPLSSSTECDVEINAELTKQTRGATVDKERAVFLHNESVTKDGWLKV